MVDESLDIDKIKQEAKTEAVKAAQDALISKLQGDKPRYSWEEAGREAPSNYDELFQEVEKRIPQLSPEEIDKRVQETIKAEREAEAKLKQEEQAKQTKSLEEQRKTFDREWYELVESKKMPAVAPEVMERINKGEKLTKEEIESDEGLKARLELAQLATSSKKSAKLTYYEDYQNRDEQPAGAKAPVLGGRTPVGSETEELKYEDVAANRKEIFGMPTSPWLPR